MSKIRDLAVEESRNSMFPTRKMQGYPQTTPFSPSRDIEIIYQYIPDPSQDIVIAMEIPRGNYLSTEYLRDVKLHTKEIDEISQMPLYCN